MKQHNNKGIKNLELLALELGELTITAESYKIAELLSRLASITNKQKGENIAEGYCRALVDVCRSAYQKASAKECESERRMLATQYRTIIDKLRQGPVAIEQLYSYIELYNEKKEVVMEKLSQAGLIEISNENDQLCYLSLLCLGIISDSQATVERPYSPKK